MNLMVLCVGCLRIKGLRGLSFYLIFLLINDLIWEDYENGFGLCVKKF